MYRLITLQRLQLLLALGCGVVTIVQMAINAPLARNAIELDRRLALSRSNLVEINLRNRVWLGLDRETVSENHMLFQHRLLALRKAGKRIKNRVDFPAEIEQRAKQSFQLLDYDQYRLQAIAALQRLAAEKKVTLGSNALAGLPEYVSGKERPSLLWVQMAMAEATLANAINSGVGAIASTTLLPGRALAGAGDKPMRQEEYSLRLELTGPMNGVMTFLLSLPLLSPECKIRQLPEPPRARPVLFINRILLKSTGANPNDVYLDAVISGLYTPEKMSDS